MSLNRKLFTQGFHPYGLTAYPRALSRFVFIGDDENVGGWAFAHFIRPPPLGARVIPGCGFCADGLCTFRAGVSPLRPCGLPPGFVAVRFLRCALKPWADGLRPSAHHRSAPVSFQGWDFVGLAATLLRPALSLMVQQPRWAAEPALRD